MPAGASSARWPLSPEPLLKDALDLWSSRALAAGRHLGVFAELGKGPRTAARLAATLGLAPAAARDLLDALLALGWLEREGDDAQAVYVSTRTSAHFLDPRSTAFLGDLLLAARQPLVGDHDGLLDDALRARDPITAPLAAAPAAWAAARALVVEGLAPLHGEALAQWMSLPPSAHVVDVEGAGTRLLCAWAAAQASGRAPAFLAVRPPAEVPVSQAQVQLAGQIPHVRVFGLPPGVGPPPHLAATGDAVVVSLLLRRDDPAPRRQALARASRWLARQGHLLLVDLLADAARREQVPALVFGLAARMTGQPRGTLTEAELRADCRATGLRDGDCLPLPGGASVLIARRAD